MNRTRPSARACCTASNAPPGESACAPLVGMSERVQLDKVDVVGAQPLE